MNPRSTVFRPLLLLAACAAVAVPACAAGFASLDAIDGAVAEFTGVATGGQGGATLPVDRRLRLAACQSQLSLSWRSERHEAVLVQCPDPGSWHLFVPVQGQAASAAPAVLRGEAISLVVNGDGFSVSQPAEALEGGAVGAWIRVRAVKDGNTKGDPIRARIVRPGLAEVPVD